MEDEIIDVYIDADGRVEIQVRGIKGDKCLEATRSVEEALGGKVEREATSEMYEQEQIKQTDRQRLGY